MIEQITVNPINEGLFSADFLKGFRCGVKRQFQADVEEIAKAKFGRPTGEWRVVSDGYGNGVATAYICECSVCGDTVWVYKDGERRWNYCPRCGAEMGGK